MYVRSAGRSHTVRGGAWSWRQGRLPEGSDVQRMGGIWLLSREGGALQEKAVFQAVGTA